MITVLVGLSSGLIYGAADFFGGTAARRIGAPPTTWGVAIVGALSLGLATLALGTPWDGTAFVQGALSGIASCFALLLLYAALAIGPMSILSPLTAVLSAVVPVVWSAVRGDGFSPLAVFAIMLALVAAVLVGVVPGDGVSRPSPLGLLVATGAGVLLGVYILMLDAAADSSQLIPTFASRLTSVVLLAVITGIWILRRRRRNTPTGTATRLDRRTLGLIVAGGFTDSLANALIMFGLALGPLSVVAVLVALYPAGTVVLAAVVHKERIALVQWIGLALAIAAAALLALA